MTTGRKAKEEEEDEEEERSRRRDILVKILRPSRGGWGTIAWDSKLSLVSRDSDEGFNCFLHPGKHKSCRQETSKPTMRMRISCLPILLEFGLKALNQLVDRPMELDTLNFLSKSYLA
jgi:hypothetical protein